MSRRRRDPLTGDLFTSAPAEPVRRFEPERVRAATISGTVSRAIAQALRECPLDRAEIARRMSTFLGEQVSKTMLDAYASQARDEHRINVPRLLALVHATGDLRLLQVMAEPFGCSVIENKWLRWIKVGQLAETRDKVNREYELARRGAHRGQP